MWVLDAAGTTQWAGLWCLLLHCSLSHKPFGESVQRKYQCEQEFFGILSAKKPAKPWQPCHSHLRFVDICSDEGCGQILNLHPDEEFQNSSFHQPVPGWDWALSSWGHASLQFLAQGTSAHRPAAGRRHPHLSPITIPGTFSCVQIESLWTCYFFVLVWIEHLTQSVCGLLAPVALR